MSNTDKWKKLEEVQTKLKKQFGKESINRLGDTEIEAIPHIPSGDLGIDRALGIGGYPRGRIIEVYGVESAGKTTLCLHAIKSAQEEGGICAFIDAEHALDPIYAENIGVDVDNLLVSQPSSGEEALSICQSLVESNSVDLIVVDSVAALTPQAEIDGDMGQSHMGLQARLMSQAMRKLTSVISKSKGIVMFTNQIRMKIGCVAPDTLISWR